MVAVNWSLNCSSTTQHDYISNSMKVLLVLVSLVEVAQIKRWWAVPPRVRVPLESSRSYSVFGSSSPLPFPERFGAPNCSPNATLVQLNQSAALPKLDYQAFWNQAWNLAVKNNASMSAHAPSEIVAEPCPKVFVYDLINSTLRDAPSHPTLEEAFGPSVGLGDSLRETPQWGLGTILEHRLRNSHECLTNDPAQADLFFVPIGTKHKNQNSWRELCRNSNVEQVLSELVHLTNSTACRHFFVIGKGHFVGTSCGGWYSNPLPIFQNAQRIAYSHVAAGTRNHRSELAEDVAQDLPGTQSMYPNLVSVPYPSHWHSTSTVEAAPWHFNKHRKTLMRYLGKDTHGDVAVRRRITDMCRSYRNEAICPTDFHFSPLQLLEKSNTVFCFEPVGDSPWRRSLADSISMGCIPVIFSPRTDETSPWHWGDWKQQARVLVPRRDFVEGRIDLYELLSTIPIELKQLMEDTIAIHARRFQYSIFEDPHDGIRAMLQGLHNRALEMEQEGKCGG